jgi:glycine/D-amino acid oxidase-like deaminating enzyme
MTEADSLPDRSDVVVIGGGIVGVTAAIFLAEAGIPVKLVEKGRIGAEQSSRNWGWIRKQGRDVRELPLMLESMRLWRDLGGRVAQRIHFGTPGTTYVAQNEEELAVRSAWLDSARDFQLDTRLLSAAETDELLGRDDRRFVGALHTASDMTAEPRLALPAFAERAREAGAVLIKGCAARGIETSGGKLSGVVTERGTIACDAAILSGGAWTRTFLENLQIFIPQLAVQSTAFRTTAAPEIHPGGLGATGASVRRRVDGGYTVGRTSAATFQIIPAAFRHFAAYLPILRQRWGIMKIRAGREFFGPLGHARWKDDEVTPFERTRVLDPRPDMGLIEDMLATARRLHPRLGDIGVAEAWGGMIDVTPDEIPVIDAAPGIPGLWIATGLSGHGFGIGPGVGEMAAQLAMGRTPIVDPSAFELSRFGGRA